MKAVITNLSISRAWILPDHGSRKLLFLLVILWATPSLSFASTIACNVIVNVKNQGEITELFSGSFSLPNDPEPREMSVLALKSPGLEIFYGTLPWSLESEGNETGKTSVPVRYFAFNPLGEFANKRKSLDLTSAINASESALIVDRDALVFNVISTRVKDLLLTMNCSGDTTPLGNLSQEEQKAVAERNLQLSCQYSRFNDENFLVDSVLAPVATKPSRSAYGRGFYGWAANLPDQQSLKLEIADTLYRECAMSEVAAPTGVKYIKHISSVKFSDSLPNLRLAGECRISANRPLAVKEISLEPIRIRGADEDHTVSFQIPMIEERVPERIEFVRINDDRSSKQLEFLVNFPSGTNLILEPVPAGNERSKNHRVGVAKIIEADLFGNISIHVMCKETEGNSKCLSLDEKGEIQPTRLLKIRVYYR